MNLPDFVQAAFADGRVRMPLVASDSESLAFSDSELGDAIRTLTELEAAERLDFPFEAPCFLPQAAQCAAKILYRACQFSVDRDGFGQQDAPANAGNYTF